MNCFIVPRDDKYATVISGSLICISKHKDYSVFHWKARDVQAITKYAITKFIFADGTGKAEEVIDASALKGRGSNYGTAKRNAEDLTVEESQELADAIVVAQGPAPTQRKADSALPNASTNEAAASADPVNTPPNAEGRSAETSSTDDIKLDLNAEQQEGEGQPSPETTDESIPDTGSAKAKANAKKKRRH